MYIKLKDKSLSKRINEFLEKNDIKYFTSLDGENIKYAILYIPNDFQKENFKDFAEQTGYDLYRTDEWKSLFGSRKDD